MSTQGSDRKWLLIFNVSFVLIQCSHSLYTRLNDGNTFFWATDPDFTGIKHTYADSREFCESLGASLPTGDQLKELQSFLGNENEQIYWLDQGEETSKWKDRSDIGFSDWTCGSRCGIHYQKGRLIQTTMDESTKAGIICKFNIDFYFFINLLRRRSVKLSSDQDEIVLAADFAKLFLHMGFYVGIGFMLIVILFFSIVSCLVWISRKSFKKKLRLTAEDSALSEPLQMKHSNDAIYADLQLKK